MNSKWLGSLKGEERENLKLSILQSKKVLDKLQEMCYNMYRDREKIEFQDYESPSWSHRQAHTNGYLEALRDVMKLTDIKPTVE